MTEAWASYPIREIAADGPSSFTDGDWVEAPHIVDNGIRLIQTGNIGVGRFIDDSKKYISHKSFDILKCTEVYPGDLLICRLAEPIGRACFAPDGGERMVTSVDVTIMRVDRESVDPRFISFVLNTPDHLRKCEIVSGGTTRQRISRSNLGKIEVKTPKVEVQRRIADILSTLDETIEQTEALIAKYQQIKAGLMHDLFTRGVTPNGSLRPAHDEAPQLYKESPLGWIPKEWTTARLNEVGDVRLGRQRAPKYDRGVNPRPYLRVVNVADDRLDLRDVGKMDFSPSEIEQYKLRPGDIVLTEGDLVSAYNVGRSAVFNGEIEECCFQNTLIRFRPRNPAHAKYLHFAFCHVRARGHLARITTATTVHHLSSGRLKEIWLPLPMNIDERIEIADRLCAVESFRDQLQAEHRKVIDLRQGVMRDLLTGRVRVRLPEAAIA